MNTFKKLFSVTAIIALLTTIMPVMNVTASFSSELQDAYTFAADNGITSASNIDVANMYGSLTRVAMAKMMANFSVDVLGNEADTDMECTFPDVSSALDAQYDMGVTNACQLSLMGVGVDNFNPYGLVTRAEFGTVLSRALYGDDYNGADPYYADHLDALQDAGIMSNISNPMMLEVRGYVMLMMERASDDADTTEGCSAEELLACITADDYDDCIADCSGDTEDDEDEVLDGDLDFRLSLSNPDATDVPLTSSYVTYLKFKVSANTDVELNSITLNRNGLGSSSDFDKVWVEDDNGMVVARAKSVPSNDEVTLSFMGDYTVKSTETLSIVASHKSTATAGNLNSFSIVDVDSSAEDVDGLTLEGENMRISSYTAARLVLTDVGSASQVDVGSNNVILGEFKLEENQGSNNKDVELVSIRLKNTGSEKVSSFDNFELYNDGDLVSDNISIDGEYITFSFDNGFEIKDGLSKNFQVKADIEEGQDTRTFTLNFKESYDLKAIEKTTGIGAAIDSASKIALSIYTLNAGKFNLSSDTTNPVSANVSYEEVAVKALVAKVALDQTVTNTDKVKIFLDNTKSSIAGAADSATLATEIDKNFKSVKLYVDGSLVDTLDAVSYTTTTDDGAIEANEFYYEFDNTFEINQGDLVEVVFTVKSSSTATANDAIAFNLSAANSFANGGLEYDNGDLVAAGDRAGTVNGNAFTIKAASLTMTDNSGYGASTNVVRGTNQAKLAKVLINAGSSSEANIKRLKFKIDANGASATEYNKYTNLVLKVNGDMIGSIVDATSNGNASEMSVTFDSLSEVIAEGGQKTFELYGNIATDATAGAITVTVLGSTNGSTVNDQSSVAIAFADKAMSTYTISAAGTIAVAVDGDTPTESIIVASTNEVEVAKFKLQATDEEMQVTDLFIANNYTAGGNAIETASDARFGNFKLYVDGALVEGAVRALSDGKLLFEDMSNRIDIPANGSVVVTVKADINSVTQDDQTNAQLKLALYAAKAISTARGVAVSVGGLPTTDTFTDAAAKHAELMYVRSTQPLLATVDLGTTKLLAGEQTIYKFTVTADSSDDVEVAKIDFDVTTQFAGSGTIGSYKLFVNGVDKTADLVAGAFALTAATFQATKDIIVSAGSSKTFELKATLGGVIATNDYITTKIVEDAATSAGNFAGVAGNFLWTDNAGSPHSRTTTDWFNGYKVNGLDTTATTLEK